MKISLKTSAKIIFATFFLLYGRVMAEDLIYDGMWQSYDDTLDSYKPNDVQAAYLDHAKDAIKEWLKSEPFCYQIKEPKILAIAIITVDGNSAYMARARISAKVENTPKLIYIEFAGAPSILSRAIYNYEITMRFDKAYLNDADRLAFRVKSLEAQKRIEKEKEELENKTRLEKHAEWDKEIQKRIAENEKAVAENDKMISDAKNERVVLEYISNHFNSFKTPINDRLSLSAEFDSIQSKSLPKAHGFQFPSKTKKTTNDNTEFNDPWGAEHMNYLQGKMPEPVKFKGFVDGVSEEPNYLVKINDNEGKLVGCISCPEHLIKEIIFRLEKGAAWGKLAIDNQVKSTERELTSSDGEKLDSNHFLYKLDLKNSNGNTAGGGSSYLNMVFKVDETGNPYIIWKQLGLVSETGWFNWTEITINMADIPNYINSFKLLLNHINQQKALALNPPAAESSRTTESSRANELFK